MIKLKVSTLLSPEFLGATVALRNSKLPLLYSKQLHKILEVLQPEKEKHVKDIEERRKELFGEELTDEQRDLLTHFESPDLEQRFDDHGYSPEERAAFRAKYKELDDYVKKLEESEVKVKAEKITLPDSFSGLSYDQHQTLKDIINLD